MSEVKRFPYPGAIDADGHVLEPKAPLSLPTRSPTSHMPTPTTTASGQWLRSWRRQSAFIPVPNPQPSVCINVLKICSGTGGAVVCSKSP